MKNVVENEKMIAEEIVEEILKNCNWWEKIIVKLFGKLILKIYDVTRIYITNKLL